MSKFRIFSSAGADFGMWEGETARDAWDAMVADGGPGTDHDGNPTQGHFEDWHVEPVEVTLDLDNLIDGVPAPLFYVYSGQVSPQPAYLDIESDGTVKADSSSDIGGGQPASVRDGLTIRFDINPRIRGTALHEYLASETGMTLLKRIHAGQTIDWDGTGYLCGMLTDDAINACCELSKALRDIPTLNVWNADDWVGEGELIDLWPGSLDEAIVLVQETIDNCDDIVVFGSLRLALIDRAENRFHRGKTLTAEQLATLVRVQRIEQDDADAYMAQQGGTSASTHFIR